MGGPAASAPSCLKILLRAIGDAISRLKRDGVIQVMNYLSKKSTRNISNIRVWHDWSSKLLPNEAVSGL